MSDDIDDIVEKLSIEYRVLDEATKAKIKNKVKKTEAYQEKTQNCLLAFIIHMMEEPEYPPFLRNPVGMMVLLRGMREGFSFGEGLTDAGIDRKERSQKFRVSYHDAFAKVLDMLNSMKIKEGE